MLKTKTQHIHKFSEICQTSQARTVFCKGRIKNLDQACSKTSTTLVV